MEQVWHQGNKFGIRGNKFGIKFGTMKASAALLTADHLVSLLILGSFSEICTCHRIQEASNMLTVFYRKN